MDCIPSQYQHSSDDPPSRHPPACLQKNFQPGTEAVRAYRLTKNMGSVFCTADLGGAVAMAPTTLPRREGDQAALRFFEVRLTKSLAGSTIDAPPCGSCFADLAAERAAQLLAGQVRTFLNSFSSWSVGPHSLKHSQPNHYSSKPTQSKHHIAKHPIPKHPVPKHPVPKHPVPKNPVQRSTPHHPTSRKSPTSSSKYSLRTPQNSRKSSSAVATKKQRKQYRYTSDQGKRVTPMKRRSRNPRRRDFRNRWRWCVKWKSMG